MDLQAVLLGLCAIIVMSNSAALINMNIEGKNYNFDRVLTFKNRLAQAAPFTILDGSEIDFDENGQAVSTHFMRVYPFDTQVTNDYSYHVPNLGIHIFSYQGN